MNAVRRGLDRVLGIVSVATFALLTIVVVWQVVTRQVFQTPAAWTEETSRYLFIILSLLAAALVFSERGHIAVEVLVRKLPTRIQFAVSIFVEAVVMFFAIYVFVIGGFRLVANAWNQSLVSIPGTAGQVYLVMPIAGIIITFYAICHLIDIVRRTEAPIPDSDDAALDV